MAEKLGSAVLELKTDKRKFGKDLKGAQKQATGLGKTFERLRGLIVAAFSVAVIVKFTRAISDTIKEMDELTKAAQKVGIGVEELSGLKFAAELAGVEFGQLQKGLVLFAQNIDDFKRGIGEAKEDLKALGIAIEDVQDKALLELFIEIGDAIGKLGSDFDKTAKTASIFGARNTALIPLFNQGAKAIRAQMEEARKLGLVFTEEAGQAAEDFDDQMKRLTDGVRGLTFAFVTFLLPALNSATVALSKFFDIPIPEELELEVRARSLRKEIEKLQKRLEDFPEFVLAGVQRDLGRALAELEDTEDRLQVIRDARQIPDIRPPPSTDISDEEAKRAQKLADIIRDLRDRAEERQKERFRAENERARKLSDIQLRISRGIRQTLEEEARKAEETAQRMRDAFQQAGDSITNIFEAFTRAGKVNIAAIINEVFKLIEALAQIQTGGLQAGGGGRGGILGALGPIGSLVGRLFSFQGGGIVPGPPEMPQLAVVHGGEQIVPRDERGGNTFLIDARGAQRGVSAEIMRAIRLSEERAVIRSVSGVKEARLRGGSFGRAFD